MTKSFFEYLGLADVERIHSQFLAWVLSDDCDAFNQQERKKLFKNIFKVSGKIIDIQTERNRIDILIKTSTAIIIVENKIKSSQHSNQLDNYKKFCEETFSNHEKHYFFLTLIGEKTRDPDWQRLTYSTIFKHLSRVKLKANNNHSSIIREYLIFLQRLKEVVSDFKTNTSSYNMVFLDGNKKKQDKESSVYKTANEQFIAANQLETILQKSFLSSLVDEIKNPTGIVNDTRGDALVDFPLESGIEFEGRKYSAALQLQKHTIKFTFQSVDYKTSDKVWIEKKVIPLMKKLSKQNLFKYKKLNPPKDLAYVSISKKLKDPYWHNSIEDLAKFINSEITNCRAMIEQLKQLLAGASKK